nr:farnesoate epoxidase-like isoform X2 [Crassostrea gigas]
METLYYIVHAPVLILHDTSQFTTQCGYSVEKDTDCEFCVLSTDNSNSWTMHHSFKPERFLVKDVQLLHATDPVRKRLGKRNCIGEVFAKSRIFLFLTSLMQMATVAEPERKPLPDFDPIKMIPGIVLQPQECEVRFLWR